MRTVVLGAIAAAAGCWWVARAYGVDGAVILDLVASSVVFVGVLIVPASILGVALNYWRRR